MLVNMIQVSALCSGLHCAMVCIVKCVYICIVIWSALWDVCIVQWLACITEEPALSASRRLDETIDIVVYQFTISLLVLTTQPSRLHACNRESGCQRVHWRNQKFKLRGQAEFINLEKWAEPETQRGSGSVRRSPTNLKPFNLHLIIVISHAIYT